MNKQNTNTAIHILIAAAMGASVAMILTLIICVIGASMISTDRAGEGSVGIISVIALIQSSVTGAFVSFKKIRQHRILACLRAGTVYFLTLLACNALFFDGQYQAITTTALVILGGSGCMMLLSLRNKRPKTHYTKYHNIKLVQNRQRGN